MTYCIFGQKIRDWSWTLLSPLHVWVEPLKTRAGDEGREHLKLRFVPMFATVSRLLLNLMALPLAQGRIRPLWPRSPSLVDAASWHEPWHDGPRHPSPDQTSTPHLPRSAVSVSRVELDTGIGCSFCVGRQW
jgi:hypothetical protein